MKTFSRLKNENKDLIYILSIDGHVLKLIKPFKQLTGTYGSLCLTVYDDSFKTLKNNPWILDIEFQDDVPEKLKEKMFFEVPASSLQTFLYT